MSATATATMTRAAFLATAKPMMVGFGTGGSIVADVKRFSTGTMGYYGHGKVTLPLGDKTQTYQVQVSLFAVKSKEWTDEQRDAYLADHAPITVAFGSGGVAVVDVKQFSTGTVGYYGHGKTVLKSKSGLPITYQVQVSLFAVKSKEWPAA